MNCDCDCDRPALYEEERRRARTPKPCEECLQWIVRGEDYVRVSVLSDRRWGHADLCLPCQYLYAEVHRSEDLCGCIAFGELWGALEEEFGEEEVRLVLGERVDPRAFVLPNRAPAEARP